MHDERWQHICELFDKAARLAGSQRLDFLTSACADDPELRNTLEALLAADVEGESIFDQPAAEYALSALAGESDESLCGQRLGPYLILETLAEGGMGAVYRAGRDDGEYQQIVAIKVIRRGLESAKMVERFQRERQILADLNHPSIVKLLDGGQTPSGLPYLVMDFVEGERIDRHCDQLRLSMEDRLRLFQQVCLAVHFAHEQRIIHRDLKPSNVLVTAEGDPKLLDFGIATSLARENAALEKTLPGQENTLHSQALTPWYSSPEQIKGRPLTPASDVYSLGLLLYEVLCGHRAQHSESNEFDQLEQVVCRMSPSAPSLAVRHPSPQIDRGLGRPLGSHEIAERRQTQTSKLARLLAGDLDHIVAKALRKKPVNRYDSAQSLAQDIGRFLGDQPVQARGDRSGYRLRKYFRRHRNSASMAILLLVALSGLATFTMAQGRWYLREQQRVQAASQEKEAALQAESASQDEAEQMIEFLVGLFELKDPMRITDQKDSISKMLDGGVKHAREGLNGQPLLQARLLFTIGKGYRLLDLLGPAEEAHQEALEIRQQNLASHHPDIAESLSHMSLVHLRQGRYEEGEQKSLRALEIRADVFGKAHPTYAFGLRGLGTLYLRQGRLEEAEATLRHALAIQEHLYGLEDPDMALTAECLAAALLERALTLGVSERVQSLHEAEALYLRSISLNELQTGPDHPVIARVLHALGNLYSLQERTEAAAAAYRRGLKIRRQNFGDHHPDVEATEIRLAEIDQQGTR